MKIKTLLITLCLLCGLQSTVYGQQTAENSKFNIQNSALHYAPPRKEIRHKIKQLPQENNFLQAATRASGEYIMQSFTTEGEVRGIVIPVSFADVHFSTKNIKEVLSQRFNGYHIDENNDTIYTQYPLTIEHSEYSDADKKTIALRATIPGSARDYFHEMSMGKFTPIFHVTDTIKLDKKCSYYGQNSKGSYNAHADEMIKEACQKVYNDGVADFSQYTNGDDTVDFVYIIFAGSDEAQTGFEDCVWAHANNITFTVSGKRITRYACSAELFIDLKGLPAGIGTFVHEFSHVLGLPDFYNTVDNGNSWLSMDVWSVMDYGMYNRGGFVPCAYTAFERYSLGWLPMTTLSEPTTLSIGTTEEEETGYRIFVDDADTTTFYLLENIRKEGWNKYAAAEGLLISMVDYDANAWRSNKVNVVEERDPSYRHYVVPANDSWEFNDTYTPALHLFGNTVDRFTANTKHPSASQNAPMMNKPLTNIKFKEGKTTFDFCGGTTDIDVETTDDGQQTTESIYDLQGRRVENSSKGIYIVNGKKVAIK